MVTTTVTAHGVTPPALSPAVIDWAVLVLPGIIWGTSFLLIAEGLAAVPPDGITFLRFVIGFAALSFVPAARAGVMRADRAGVAGLGVIWLALPMSMFPHAEQHVSSALTGMLNGAVPIVAAAVAALLAHQAPPRRVAAGLALGFAGAVVMAVPGMSGGTNSMFGVALILIAVASYGVAINIARPLQQRNGALPVVWHALGVAAVLTAPLGVPALMAARWQLTPMLAIVALGVLGTAAANVLMAVATGRLGAARASGTTFLIPVVSLVLGVTVRGEHVPAAAVAGAALCLAGAWTMRRGSMQR